MGDSVTYVLTNDSQRDLRKVEQLSALQPTRLHAYDEIVDAARHARPEDLWIALHRATVESLVRAATEVRRSLGLLLVLSDVRPETISALAGSFRRVTFRHSTAAYLPPEELGEVLVARDRDRLFIGGSVDRWTQTVTLWRGNLEPLVVPLSTFQPTGDSPKPNFAQFAVADYGHTVKFGDYESAADAILYERDPAFRKKLRDKRRQEEKGFGPSLRRLRLQRGLNRSDFAPLSDKTIARIERGEVEQPRGKSLQVISERLGVEAESIETF